MSAVLNSPQAKRRRFRPYPKYKDSGVEWLGEIPAHWEVNRLRHTVISIKNGTTATQLEYGETEFRVTRIETISSGVIDLSKTGFISSSRDIDDYLLERGDVLLSHINSIAMLGNCARYDLDVPLYGGMNLLRLRPRNSICGDWLWNWMRSLFGRESVRARAKPAINQASVPISSLRDIPIFQPPLSDQRTIADFLGRETAKIDTLIEKKERLIELLQEKRTALITQAVTKGLDPNVSMKNSGVEWLGKIPAHWDVLRLKYLSSINDEVLNEKTDPRFELFYIDIGGVDQYRGIVANEELLFETAPSRARRIVRDGDVIISTVRTYLRAVAPIKHPESNLIVSTGFSVIRPSSALDKNFAPYALRTSHFIESIVANSVGVSYPAIDTSKMSCFPLTIPGIEEQQYIAAFLDRETAKIDALVAKIREAIVRLKEYRTALISAAVTGKIDVRDLFQYQT